MLLFAVSVTSVNPMKSVSWGFLRSDLLKDGDVVISQSLFVLKVRRHFFLQGRGN